MIIVYQDIFITFTITDFYIIYHKEMERKIKKSEGDSERIIACIVVFGPILLAIIDRVMRELGYW